MKRLFIMFSVLMYSIVATAQTIEVKYSGSTADVTIPESISGVTSTVDGAHVTIISSTTTNEYIYHLTGSTTNGSLTISGSYKLTLQLDGVNIKSGKGAAINVACGKRIAVEIKDGTENTLEDNIGGSQNAAMYFTGHPEFQGGGVLNVKGNTGHAIAAKEYLQIKKSCGTINILGAVKDGIHCGKGKVSAWDETLSANEMEFFVCNGGTINISNVGSDCIDAGDYGCMNIKGGSLNLDVAASKSCGLKCVNTLIMDGGDINIDVSGQESDGIYINNKARFNGGNINVYVTGNGSKGIKGKLKDTTPYTSGGNVDIAGTKISIVATGGDVISATKPDDPSHCVALSVDGNLTNIGTDNVSLTSVGDEAKSITCDGTQTGTFKSDSRHWYVHPYDYKNSMSIYAVVDGFKATDYANYEVAAFIGNECRGTLSYTSDGYGYMRIYSDSEVAETITFRLYNSTKKQEIECDNAEGFNPNGVVGKPSDPIKILYTPKYLRGDVNLDGTVNISDVTMLVNIILGKSSPTISSNVNEDSDINISDVTTLVNIILGK